MELLRSFNLTDDAVRARAPAGLIYNVKMIHVAIVTVLADNYLIIANRWLEDIADTIRRTDRVATFSTAIAGNYFLDGLEEFTKYLTIGKTNATSLDAVVNIYGELVKGSKIQLVMEWFRKAR